MIQAFTSKRKATLRIPLVLLLFVAACGLVSPDDDYFGGDGNGGSGAASGVGGGAGSDPTAGSGAMSVGGGEAGAGAGGSSGGAGGSSGEVGGASGGAGGASGGAGGASGGAGGASGGAGAVSGAAGNAGADCGLPATRAEEELCGACNTGKRTRTFTLTAACDYVETDLTSCSGETAACSPGTSSPCVNGEPCGQRVCSSTCEWGPCEVTTGNECLTIGDGHTELGSRYKCCGFGMWRFCLPPKLPERPHCEWSSDCASCSQGAPSFCSDCYD